MCEWVWIERVLKAVETQMSLMMFQDLSGKHVLWENVKILSSWREPSCYPRTAVKNNDWTNKITPFGTLDLRGCVKTFEV